MTVRMSSCRALASSRAEVARITYLYQRIEDCATAVKLLFPWFPGRDKRESAKCTKELYETLYRYVDGRRKAPEGLGSDAIDVLIEDGHQNLEIVQVRFGIGNVHDTPMKRLLIVHFWCYFCGSRQYGNQW